MNVKKFISTPCVISVLVALFVMLLAPAGIFAASLTAMSDTLSTQKASTVANHRVVFTSTSGVASGTIEIDFVNAASSSGSVDYTDIDLSYGTLGTETEATLAASAASGVWGASFSSRVLTLTYPTASGTAIAAGNKVIVKIGTNATGGNAQMTNSTSGNSKVVTITAGADSGKLAVALVDDSSVGSTSTVVLPTAPSGLNATASRSTSVSLTWTDNSTNETLFLVERSASGGSYAQITSVGAGSTSYTDDSASSGIQYSYRVRATNGVDNSAYSTVATVSTPGGAVAVSTPLAPTSTTPTTPTTTPTTDGTTPTTDTVPGSQTTDRTGDTTATDQTSSQETASTRENLLDDAQCLVSCRPGCPCSTTDALGNSTSGSGTDTGTSGGTGTTGTSNSTGGGSTSGSGTGGNTSGSSTGSSGGGTTGGTSGSSSGTDTSPNTPLNKEVLSAPTISNIDSEGDVGKYISSTIGFDGFSRIAYQDATKGDLKFAQCLNADCSKSISKTIDTKGSVGKYTSMDIGEDGFVRIVYYDETNGDLKFVRCLNADCSEKSITIIDSKGRVGTHAKILLDQDGFAMIVYYDETNRTVKYCQCHDIECVTYDIIIIDDGDGEPWPPDPKVDGPVIVIMDPPTEGGGPIIDIQKTPTSKKPGVVRILCDDKACKKPVRKFIAGHALDFIYKDPRGGGDSGHAVVYADIKGPLELISCKDDECDPKKNSPIFPPIDNGPGIIIPPIGDPGFFDQHLKFIYLKNGEINIVICDDDPCQKRTVTLIKHTGGAGDYLSPTIGPEGNPKIPYYDEKDGDLKYIECNNPSCSEVPVDTTDTDSSPVPAVTSIGMSSTDTFITNPLVWNVVMTSGGVAPYDNKGTFCTKTTTNFVPCIPVGAFGGSVYQTSINMAGALYPLTFDEAKQCYTGTIAVPSGLGSYMMSLRTVYKDGRTTLVDSEVKVQDSCADFELAAIAPNPLAMSGVVEDIFGVESSVNTINKQAGTVVKKGESALEIASIAATVSIIAFAPSVVGNLPNAYHYVYQSASWFFSLFGYKKKRRKTWGIVYNAYSKEPEPLVIVRLYDAITKKLLETQVTDKTGRFSFITQAGTYVVKVSKSPFLFPTEVVKGNSDGVFGNVYRGGEIRLGSDNDEISISIPIDPQERATVKARSFMGALKDVLEKVSPYVAGVSFIVSLSLIWYNPNLLNSTIFVLNSLLILLQFLIVYRAPKSWGIIFDDSTFKPLSLATISLFDAQTNKLVRSRLSDMAGRFNFLAPAGHYKIMVTRANYDFPVKPTKKKLPYKRLYFGEELHVKRDNGVIRVNIPLHKRPLVTGSSQ